MADSAIPGARQLAGIAIPAVSANETGHISVRSGWHRSRTARRHGKQARPPRTGLQIGGLRVSALSETGCPGGGTRVGSQAAPPVDLVNQLKPPVVGQFAAVRCRPTLPQRAGGWDRCRHACGSRLASRRTLARPRLAVSVVGTPAFRPRSVPRPRCGKARPAANHRRAGNVDRGPTAREHAAEASSELRQTDPRPTGMMSRELGPAACNLQAPTC